MWPSTFHFPFNFQHLPSIGFPFSPDQKMILLTTQQTQILHMYKNNTPFYTRFHKLKITFFLYYFSVRSCFWLDIEKVIRDGKKKNGHSGRRENILFLFYMYFMYNKEESESCMAWHGIQIPIIQVLRSPDHYNRCSQHLIKNSHPFCLSQKVCKLLTKQKRTFLFIQQRQH